MDKTTVDLSKDCSSDSCVICLSEVSERAVTVPCNHSAFDFLCLVSWLQQRSACPLCKTEVTAVQYNWRSPSDFKTYSIYPTPLPHEAATTASTVLNNSPRYRHRLLGRPRTFRIPDSPSNPDAALLRRRYVYRKRLYSLHVGTNRLSRYQELTPRTIAESPELQSRAKMWIRRELRVFSFLDSPGTPCEDGPTTSSNAEFLLSYIISVIKVIDMKCSTGRAEDLLQEFLGRENTRLFLHELSAWLRSPYTKLRDWDRHVQYSEELPDTFDEQGQPVFRGKERRCTTRSRSPGIDQERERRRREAPERSEPD